MGTLGQPQKAARMKAAFMVIDMQKTFYSGAGKASMDAATEYINAALPISLLFRLIK